MVKSSLLAVLAILVVGPAEAQGPTPNVNDGAALLRECGAALTQGRLNDERSRSVDQ